MKKIFHFLLPEKITSNIIENFEELDCENFYFFFDDVSNIQISFPRTQYPIFELSYTSNEIHALIAEYNPGLILLHSLSYKFSKVVLSLSRSIPIAWIPWGYDIYSLPKLRLSLYGHSTFSYILKKQPFFKIKNLVILYCLEYLPQIVLKQLNLKYYRETLLAHSKINYFVSYLKEDFEVFSRFYETQMKFIYSPYLKLEQYLGQIDHPQLQANTGKILVGNSASLESNYFDVVDVLKNHKNKFSTSYFVLNYGHDSSMIEDFRTYAGSSLGPSANFMTEFMELKEYIEFLKTCNTAVFLHHRQQAMGNIFTLLYLGARVYLSKSNPVLGFFKNFDLLVFIFEDDFEHYGTQDLTVDEKKCNVVSLKKLLQSDASMYKNILELII